MNDWHSPIDSANPGCILRLFLRKRVIRKERKDNFDLAAESSRRAENRTETEERMEECFMLPSMFGENLFDDFFADPFEMHLMPQGRSPLYGKHAKNMMKTDVRETENSYELDIDLPGFKKDEVDLELKDGYLTISADKQLDKDEKDNEGRYIRQERWSGSCSRSFYVGENVEPSDVKAKFEDGILRIALPKQEAKQLPATTAIAIE